MLTTATLRRHPLPSPALELGVRLPAEARQVADAAGGRAAGRRHPARRRRRLPRRIQAAAPWGSARSTACALLACCDRRVVVGDPVAAGIVAEPLYVFLKILQGAGAPIFARWPDLRDRRRPGHRQERRRLGAGRHRRLPGDERTWRRRRRARDQDRDGPRPADPRHRRLRRHHDRHHRRLPVQPVLPDQAAPVPGILRRQAVRPDRDRLCRHRARRVLAFLWPPIGDFINYGANRVISANARSRCSSTAWSSAPCCPSACTTSGTRRSSSPSTSAAGATARHPHLLLPRTPGVRHLRRRLPGQDVRPARGRAGDLSGAKPENRVRIGLIMLAAALTAFLTGITEPLEFSFLFVAPLLYVVHAFMYRLAVPLMYLSGGRSATRSPRAPSTTRCSMPTASSRGWC